MTKTRSIPHKGASTRPATRPSGSPYATSTINTRGRPHGRNNLGPYPAQPNGVHHEAKPNINPAITKPSTSAGRPYRPLRHRTRGSRHAVKTKRLAAGQNTNIPPLGDTSRPAAY